MADKKRHGTEGRGGAKLTVDAVRAIKIMIGLGSFTGEKLAEIFGVTPSAISQIRTGKIHPNVTIHG